MRLLTNVVTVGLLVAFMQVFTQPLQAQGASVYSWFSSSPADGSWFAGASIQYGGDPNCDFCSTDVGLNMLVYENGVGVNYQSGSDPSGTLELDYNSPTIVGLNTPYVVTGQGTWDDQYGQEVGDYKTTDTTPGIPNVSLNNIDASNPYQILISYASSPADDLYSSTVTIGDQNAISGKSDFPVFAFDQSLYPGMNLAGATTVTPITFYGRLAGHQFEGPSCWVSVSAAQSLVGNFTFQFAEGGNGPAVQALSVTHTGSVNFNSIGYCIPTYGGDVNQINAAQGSIDTSHNSCLNVDCDISQIQEVHRFPGFQDPMSPEPGPCGGMLQISCSQFQAQWAVYPSVAYPALWLTEGTVTSVCNTLLLIQNVGPMGPMGCVNSNFLLP